MYNRSSYIGIISYILHNIQLKNIVEEEKKFDSRTLFFLENSPLLDVF